MVTDPSDGESQTGHEPNAGESHSVVVTDPTDGEPQTGHEHPIV